jgi:hypothetical protein
MCVYLTNMSNFIKVLKSHFSVEKQFKVAWLSSHMPWKLTKIWKTPYMSLAIVKGVIKTKGPIRNWRHWQHLAHTTPDALCLNLTIVCMYGGYIYFSHLKLLSWNYTGSW